jgi:hypothetical protein
MQLHRLLDASNTERERERRLLQEERDREGDWDEGGSSVGFCVVVKITLY